MTTDATELTAALAQRRNASPYAGFAAALQAWLLRADRSQKELAKALTIDPSAVTYWMQGQKGPDGKSLVKLLAAFHGWFRADWDPLEALDAIACLGYDWSKIEEASVRHFQPGGDVQTIQSWWERARPAPRRLYLPPRPVIHVRREIEHDLAASLTALLGYRQARWRAVILYGMAGIGKTAMAQALADDDQVKRAFRDGIAWVDGSRDPKEEVMRLCLDFSLERELGERWIECWRRWAGAAVRRLLLIVDDAISAEGVSPLIAGLGPQVVAMITTQQGTEIRGEVERWLPAEAVMEVGVHGLAPTEGRALVEAVAARSLSDVEWELVQEIGERVGWHPEALRLSAIEGREIGWEEPLGELRAGRMPWNEVRRLVLRQWARLLPDQRDWLTALVRGSASGATLAVEEAARLWQVEATVAERRLWILEHDGLAESHVAERTQRKQWSVVRVAQPPFGQLTLRQLDRHSGG